MNEEWKDIEGFDGFYQVSNMGSVRAMRDTHDNELTEPRLRKLSVNKDGYQKVRLIHYDKDMTCRVHRLVAEAFIPNPYGYQTVNHINGDKTDNRVENLEWADRSYQMFHAYEHKLKKPMRGTLNCQAKLTEEDVREIRKTCKKNDREYGTVALSKRYGVSNRVIGLVVNGQSYKNVY